MFGMSGTELIIVIIVALLVLGPKKLPDLARSAGKALREFRKATEGIRHTVEQEFYKMDQDIGISDALAPEDQQSATGAPVTAGVLQPHPQPTESVPATPAPAILAPAPVTAVPAEPSATATPTAAPAPAIPGDKK